MRPALLAALLRDLSAVAQRLVQCRVLLPGVDPALLFVQQPELLLQARMIAKRDSTGQPCLAILMVSWVLLDWHCSVPHLPRALHARAWIKDSCIAHDLLQSLALSQHAAVLVGL